MTRIQFHQQYIDSTEAVRLAYGALDAAWEGAPDALAATAERGLAVADRETIRTDLGRDLTFSEEQALLALVRVAAAA